MKLSMRMAGLCGSAAFIVTALPGFFQQLNPNTPVDDSFLGLQLLERLGFSLLGAVIAGILGFQVGKVMSRPAGRKKKKTQKKPALPASAPTPEVNTAAILEGSESTSPSPEPEPAASSEGENTP